MIRTMRQTGTTASAMAAMIRIEKLLVNTESIALWRDSLQLVLLDSPSENSLKPGEQNPPQSLVCRVALAVKH
jgi:hypothetical protein